MSASTKSIASQPDEASATLDEHGVLVAHDGLVEHESLIEEVSIDGMCGVY